MMWRAIFSGSIGISAARRYSRALTHATSVSHSLDNDDDFVAPVLQRAGDLGNEITDLTLCQRRLTRRWRAQSCSSTSFIARAMLVAHTTAAISLVWAYPMPIWRYPHHMPTATSPGAAMNGSLWLITNLQEYIEGVPVEHRAGAQGGELARPNRCQPSIPVWVAEALDVLAERLTERYP